MALINAYPDVQLPEKSLALRDDVGIKGLHSEIPQKFHPHLQAYIESMILRRLLPGTRDIYLKCFKKFLAHHLQADINALSHRMLLNYFKAQSVKRTPAGLKQSMSAIKFYYEHTLGRHKMCFALAKDKKPSLFTLFLPFYDLRDLIHPIDSPGDKLLLFLVYHANIPLSKICKLPKDAYDIFQNQLCMSGNDEPAIQYFQGLVSECKEQYRQNTYLIENKGRAHSLSTLKRKIFRILAHYSMEDIYRKQYQQILHRAGFNVRTRAMYLNAFMKFLHHFNYKHPAFISDEEIRAYKLLLRKKSAWQQKNFVSSLKFFFEKVHKRPLSHQHAIRLASNMPKGDKAQRFAQEPLRYKHYKNYKHHKHTHIEIDTLCAFTAYRNHSPP